MDGLRSTEARLVNQAIWFFIHVLASLVIWGVTMTAITVILHPTLVDPAITLALAFCVPLLVALVGARIRPSESSTLTWFAGVIWFMIWGLYVLDMPTGPTACYHCGATAKLWLTFLSFTQDSGLLDGQGRFLATWPAVAMIGYSIGARIGLAGADMPLNVD
jgi:hypothetical protein